MQALGSIENEEGKVTIDILSAIYDFEEKKSIFKLLFSCFDYFLFILPTPWRLYYLDI